MQRPGSSTTATSSPVVVRGPAYRPQQPAATDMSVLLKFGGVKFQGVRVFADGTKFAVVKSIWCERLDFDTDLELHARCGGQMRQDLVGKSFEVEPVTVRAESLRAEEPRLGRHSRWCNNLFLVLIFGLVVFFVCWRAGPFGVLAFALFLRNRGLDDQCVIGDGDIPVVGRQDQAVPEAVDTVESSAFVPRNGFHLEPRCRICRNDEVRPKVNDLLATGASYASIVRSLAEQNAALDKGDRITIDSVRNHCRRHFPVQQTAHATYRQILERRARENQVDFVEGVATAITPLGFYDVVMTKAFRTLADDGTEVSVETGLRAAERLQSVLDGRERGTDILKLKVELGQITEAVRSVVPQSMWGEIIEKVEQLEERAGSLAVEADAYDGMDDAYDPMEFADEDDELWQ